VLADAPDFEIVAQDVLSAGYWNMARTVRRVTPPRSRLDQGRIAGKCRKACDRVDRRRPARPRYEDRAPGGGTAMEKVLGYIETGRDEGANVVIGVSAY